MSTTTKIAEILLNGTRPAELWQAGADVVLLWGALNTNPGEAFVEVEGEIVSGADVVIIERAGGDRIPAEVVTTTDVREPLDLSL